MKAGAFIRFSCCGWMDPTLFSDPPVPEMTRLPVSDSLAKWSESQILDLLGSKHSKSFDVSQSSTFLTHGVSLRSPGPRRCRIQRRMMSTARFQDLMPCDIHQQLHIFNQLTRGKAACPLQIGWARHRLTRGGDSGPPRIIGRSF